jgi:hypothetical protein
MHLLARVSVVKCKVLKSKLHEFEYTIINFDKSAAAVGCRRILIQYWSADL